MLWKKRQSHRDKIKYCEVIQSRKTVGQFKKPFCKLFTKTHSGKSLLWKFMHIHSYQACPMDRMTLPSNEKKQMFLGLQCLISFKWCLLCFVVIKKKMWRKYNTILNSHGSPAYSTLIIGLHLICQDIPDGIIVQFLQWKK